MTRFRTSTESAREVAADLLIVPAFTDGEPGPGLKDVGLADAYAAARLSGKKGEDLLVTRREGDRFAAGAVLVGRRGAEGRLRSDDDATDPRASGGVDPPVPDGGDDVRARLRRAPGRRRGASGR